jgi:hypothetical protein
MASKTKSKPLFTVVLVEGGLTMIGYDRLEVLAFLPFHAVQHSFACPDADCENEIPAWLYRSWVVCRTKHGLMRLPDELLFEEIEDGIYVEEGTSDEQIEWYRQRRQRRDELLDEQDGEDGAELC